MTASNSRSVAVIAVVGALLGGCSTAPRDFTPTLAVAPSVQEAFEKDLGDCKAQVASGRRSDFTQGRTTAVVAGTAVAAGAGLAAGATAASGMGMMAGAAGAAGLAAGFVVVAPIAILTASRTIRGRKERQIKAATETCLQEHGYAVTEWTRSARESRSY